MSPLTSLRLLRYMRFLSAHKGKIIVGLILLLLVILSLTFIALYGFPKVNRSKRSIKDEEITFTSTVRPSTTTTKEPCSTEDNEYEYDYDESGYPQNKTRNSSKLKNIICYYGSWSVYRKGAGKFSVNMIDPFMCTHIIYSFVGLSKSYELASLDPWNDFSAPTGLGSLKKLTNLKQNNPKLKIMVAIGGWNQGSANYSIMASSLKSRTKFIKSVLSFLEKHNLDGLDIDWEYPAARGGKAYDKQNFVLLLRSLHRAFRRKHYLLTIAVASNKETIDAAYDIPKIMNYVDFVNLMSYDYHGQWDKMTGLNAPLYRSRYPSSSPTSNVNWTVNYWIRNGMKAEKMMLGLGLYGHSFTLNDKSQHTIDAPSTLSGKPGKYTKENGTLSYLEICSLLKEHPDKWTIVRSPKDNTPYAFYGDQWIGYDDAKSIEVKVEFAKSKNLGGVMIWSIDQDDTRGHCHDEKFPLMTTITSLVRNQNEVIQKEPIVDSTEIDYDLGEVFTSTRPTYSPSYTLNDESAMLASLDQTTATALDTTYPVCGENGQWWFPGPSCRQYFDCTSGIPQLKDCGSNKFWRQSKRYCDYKPDSSTLCS